MAIVVNKDAGLIQGLQTAGNALAATLTHNALMRAQENQQKKQQAQYAQLASKLQGKPIDQNLLFSLLAEPGGMEALKTLGPLLGGVLKENARSAGAGNWLQNAVLQATGGHPQNPQNPEAPQMPYGINQGVQSAGQGILDSVMGSLTPIDQPMNDGYHLNKDFYERNGLAKPDISDLQEWRSGTLNAPAVSGVPSAPPLPDENRVGPREQTKFQMGGQSGMDLHPPQENFRQVPIKQPIPQISDLNADQQEKLAQILSGSPYQEHRDLAKNIQDQVKQNTRNFHEDRKY
ncbi:MAG TPA: hypothetical protein PL000_07320, partial [Anaerolineales bacterium]|nr:hypothetical protein [Anaerolineales bacterium]